MAVHLFCYDARVGDLGDPDVVVLTGRLPFPNGRARVTVSELNRTLYFRPRVDTTEEQLCAEIRASLEQMHVQGSTLTAVTRRSCWFGASEQKQKTNDDPLEDYVQLRYSFVHQNFPQVNIRDGGEHYESILGSSLSVLELFLVERKIKGPCWLTLEEAKDDDGSLHVVGEGVSVDNAQAPTPPFVLASVAFSATPTTVIAMHTSRGAYFSFVVAPAEGVFASDERSLRRCRDQTALWAQFLRALNREEVDIVVGFDLSAPRRRRCIEDGRLVCDIRASASEFLGKNHTAFAELVQTHLQKITLHVPTSSALLDQVDFLCHRAKLGFDLVGKLKFIELTLELTRLRGNLLSQSFQSLRAAALEYLLMHEFARQDFLIPDRAQRVVGSFAGGLILDPLVGIYDRLVLLLDFRSMYPSIIQEHKICFSNTASILPFVVGELLAKRRAVKLHIPTAVGSALASLDTKQKALKLVANSIFGCLGYAKFRFCCPWLAALIARNGQHHLRRAKRYAEELDGGRYKVVFGATDSIMVNTNTRELDVAIRVADRVRVLVNSKMKFMELECEAIFTNLVLFRQKNWYAAKSRNKPLLQKGLSRSDACLFSRDLRAAVLRELLSGEPPNDIRVAIRRILTTAKRRLETGQVPTREFVKTTRLSKNLHDYPSFDLPHLYVAREMAADGFEVHQGSFISYAHTIRCGASQILPLHKLFTGSSKDEVFEIDLPWYWKLVQESVKQMCAPLESELTIKAQA